MWPLVLWVLWIATLVLAFFYGRWYEAQSRTPPDGGSGNGGERVRKVAVF